MIVHPDDISKVLKETLPGAISHRKMLPPNRVLKAPGNGVHIKYSSVLLLLFLENDNLIACLIKRPSHMKHHAGQIALPGGRIENNETAEETALRETFEEIGVPSSSIRILGSLSEFYVEVSGFQIHPIVGWLDKKPELKLNKDEVERAIFFPVKNFKPPYSSVELQTVTGKLLVPCIRYLDEIIWGATAMILSEFCDVVSK